MLWGADGPVSPAKQTESLGSLLKKEKRAGRLVRSFWNPGLGKFCFALVASTCAGRLAWGIHRCQGDLLVAAGSLSSEVGALFPWCWYPCQLTDILLLSLSYFHCTGRGWRPLWRPTPSGGPPCALSPLKTSLQCKSSKVSVQRAVERAGEEGGRAATCSAVRLVGSRILLSSWLLWKDTAERVDGNGGQAVPYEVQ